jgi:hypothetical protein
VEVAEESAQSMVRLCFLVEVEVKGVIGGGYKVIVVVVGLQVIREQPLTEQVRRISGSLLLLVSRDYPLE